MEITGDIKAIQEGVAELTAQLKELRSNHRSPEQQSEEIKTLVKGLFEEYNKAGAAGDNSRRSSDAMNDFNKSFPGLDFSNGKMVQKYFVDMPVNDDLVKGDFNLARVKEFQRLNDEIIILSTLTKQKPSELKSFRQYQEIVKFMNSTSSGNGSDWVPTLFSNRLAEKVRLQLLVAGLFEQFNMPSNPYTWPIEGSDIVAYKAGQSSDELGTGGTWPESSPGTANLTFTAVKVAAKTIWADEADEDSIIPLVGHVEDKIALAIRNALEICILNGDTAVSHQDSDVTLPNDRRKLWNGLRKLANSGAKVDLGTFSLGNVRKLRQKMVVYGVDPNMLAYIASIVVYNKLLNLDGVTTVDKYGQNATILKGELGKIDNIPIVLSEFMRDDLNASGVYDGSTTTKSGILLVRKDQWKIGNRREMRLESDRNIERGTNILVASQRSHFREVVTPIASHNIVAYGYNIDASTT